MLTKLSMSTQKLDEYQQSARKELKSILSWWVAYMPDQQHGGFYGSVNDDNIPDLGAPKGIVLNSRILWSFSAAYQQDRQQQYREMADRAFRYITDYFIDHEHGGVYWSVDQDGKMLDGRKQIYGLAFCLYGLSEYYKITLQETVLDLAGRLCAYIERYSLDKERGGYIEAFTRDWQPLDDLRLSEKDDNEKKTMNTHLHIIEAYANFYSIAPREDLREKIASLLELFDRYFFNGKTKHLNLFFSEEWNVRSSLISYGHDIEAAWLLLHCAEVIGHNVHIDRFREIAIELAHTTLEGIDADGGLWYEYEPANNSLVREKHSWPQAEAMIGFLQAYEIEGDESFLQASLNSYAFIHDKIIDHRNGEWHWGIDEYGRVMNKEKAGFWKCPYHSTRACIEVSRRINHLIK